ncbi:hypothetical protein L6R50_19735 [Myxococcota bacterium]|nr:hypothetical protein [Myxococcota bacterium]
MHSRESAPPVGRAWLASEPVTRVLRPFLAWITERHAALDGVTEVRVIRRGPDRGVWAGTFGPGDVDILVESLAPVLPRARGLVPPGDHPRDGEAAFYFSMQAVEPSAIEGGRGRLQRARTTTRDRDIRAYCLFAVDVDPERNPKDASATDAEKAEALAVAEQVRAWFEERGVQPALADSGNGYHLLVPTRAYLGEDVGPASADARTLLELLDARFSTPGAKVDTSIFNPARILKLYGTRAVKGESTAKRPHRVASVDVDALPRDVELFARLGDELQWFREDREAARRRPPPLPPPPVPVPAERRPAPAPPSPSTEADWKAWRERALAALDLAAVYGDLLTGRRTGTWLECRDPDSESGDRNPSAGVADGTGEAERGSFHSFRTGRTESVFDFLVRLGRTADFRAACAEVADLSGESLPARERTPVAVAPPPDPGEALVRLASAWPEAPDDAARDALVRDAVAAVVGLPALEHGRALARIREVTGVPARLLERVAAEARKAAGEGRRTRRARPTEARPASPDGPAPPARPGLPVVDFVENADTVDDRFAALLRVVAPTRRFFRSDSGLVFVRAGGGPETITERSLPGLLSAHLEIAHYAVDGDGDRAFRGYGVLSAEMSRAFVHSPRVLEALPALRTYTRSPVFDAAWSFVGTPGYHEGSGIYYDGPEVVPGDGTALLQEALRDFAWKGEADPVNFIGVLLTALTMPHWLRGHPFLAINGNKPGVGKSTLARVLGILVEGQEPATISFVPDDAEFEKQLATRIEAGDRVLIVDNAKTSATIESPVLERCITDTRLNFRRLGSNTAITRPHNDVLFVLTMNLTQLGRDLRRRALPVNLELAESVREARYTRPDLLGFVAEHRLAIVAELAGMVRRWLDAGRPEADEPARHSTSQAWAGTVDAVLRLSGFDGFLDNFEDSEHAFDPSYALMVEVCATHRDRAPATAEQWAAVLVDGVLEERLKDRRGNPRPKRSQATVVGRLFSAYLDTTFTVEGRRYRLVQEHPRGSTHPPTYAFAEVASREDG